MPVEELLDDATRKKRVRRLVISVIIGAIVLHVIIGLVAAVFIVARYFQPPPATFEVKRDLRIEAQEREHAMNMAAMDSMTPKPSFNDKLQSLRPTAISLPDLPKVPMDQMVPLDPSAIVSDQVSSMIGTAGLGSGGQGGGVGGGGTGTSLSFLGIQTTAKRVLILYDIAQSVVGAAARAGYPMDKIREETKKLLGGVGVNTRFGMGQFARNYAFFETELLPASDPNREKAVAWLDQWFATEGTMPRGTPNMVTGSPGFIEVLRASFRMQPDVIFVISDAQFERGAAADGGARIPWPELADAVRELQKTVPEPVKIHFIGVGMRPENEREMRRIISGQGGGGRFRKLQ